MCRHAVAITPEGPLVLVASRGVSLISPVTAAFPVMLAGRLPHHCFRGLLSVHSRYGLPARGVAKATLSIEGSGGFVTSTAAPIATGWSDPVAGRELHPLKIHTFARRTQNRTLSQVAETELALKTGFASSYGDQAWPKLRILAMP